MTRLIPMPAESFGAFAERSIANYAHENVASFRWDEASALEHARVEFNRALPQGMATPEHFLRDIVDDDNTKVGELWFAVAHAHGGQLAYLWDIYIDIAARREHHARAAMQALEAECRERGARALGLQVFAHNAVAQALYTSMGFSVTGFNMVKRIDPT